MMLRSCSALAARRHLVRKCRTSSSSSLRLFRSTAALSDALDPVDTFARRHSTFVRRRAARSVIFLKVITFLLTSTRDPSDFVYIFLVLIESCDRSESGR
jgi:hypothetical protein